MRDEQGCQQLVLEGVPIGFAQVGLTFDPESAFIDAWMGRFQHGADLIEFRVLDPTTIGAKLILISMSQNYRPT